MKPGLDFVKPEPVERDPNPYYRAAAIAGELVDLSRYLRRRGFDDRADQLVEIAFRQAEVADDISALQEQATRLARSMRRTWASRLLMWRRLT